MGYCPSAPLAASGRTDLVFACARRATPPLWVNRVLPACAACSLETGRSYFCPCRVLHDNPVMGEPGIARARRLPCARAARQPRYGRTGYCPRAPPAALGQARFGFCARAVLRDSPVLGEPGIVRACRLLPRDRRILFFCALCASCVMGEPRIARSRRLPCWDGGILFLHARRATAPFWANQVLPACASCRLRTGGFGFCALARTAPRDCPAMGEPGIARPRRLVPWQGRIQFCARAAPRNSPVLGEPRIARARRSPPWDGRILFLRVPRDDLVIGEPGIARARRLLPWDGQIRFLRVRTSAAPEPRFGRNG